MSSYILSTITALIWALPVSTTPKKLTFLTSELLGSVVQVIMRDTANLVSLEFTKSAGSICRARDSMYFRIATFTCNDTKIKN